MIPCRLQNADLVPTEKQVLEKMTPSTSILLLQLASEHLAMLNDKKKISSLCLNTAAGYSEEAPSIMIKSQLCISVPLSTSCTDFAANSKFSANRGSYLQCFS